MTSHSDFVADPRPRVREAAKAEEVQERLVRFIEGGCAPRPHAIRPKPKFLYAFQFFLGGMAVAAIRKDRWNHAATFAGLGLTSELFGHGIFDPDFPIRLRLDSHAASRQVAAGNALALGLGGEGVGAGLGFFGGASPGNGDKDVSLGAGASTAARLSGKGK